MAGILHAGAVADSLLHIRIEIHSVDGRKIRKRHASDGDICTGIQAQGRKQIKAGICRLLPVGFITVFCALHGVGSRHHISCRGHARALLFQSCLITALGRLIVFLLGLGLGIHLIIGTHQALGRQHIAVDRFLAAGGLGFGFLGFQLFRNLGNRHVQHGSIHFVGRLCLCVILILFLHKLHVIPLIFQGLQHVLVGFPAAGVIVQSIF